MSSEQNSSDAKARPVDTLVMRLRGLLPSLEYSRETHVIWRDCDQKYRDEQPSVGDKHHHEMCIADYDDRIAVINDAIKFIESSA